MIFVDTSIWIASLRDRRGFEAEHLDRLLDDDQVALAAVVRIELLSGASRADFPRLRRALSGLPIYYPTDLTWARIDAWVERAVAAGQRFGVADLLIAATVAERDGTLWSLDADFTRMARMRLVELHAPS